MGKRLRHAVNMSFFLLIFILFEMLVGGISVGADPFADIYPISRYGTLPTILLYLLRALAFLTMPMAVFNCAGLVSYNTSPDRPELKSSPLLGPFICFRVVTRGTFPDLVRETLNKNLDICNRVGIKNFQFEIVTDNAINLPKSPLIREIVVPTEYKTEKGTLYKARALNYCWEKDVNAMTDGDWIVHLDEETALTESSVIGVVNFATSGKNDFGQGIIMYTQGEIVNWITTLADTIRVGLDYGMLRFCLKFLHKPLFSWKGSFIVSRASAEKSIRYDFGPEGSIAEDCFFAMIAWKKGYLFDYVEGVMYEKSPFTLMDFIQQRKRWVQGITLTYESTEIPYKCKFGLWFMVYSWIFMPLTTSNLILSFMFPIPLWQSVNFLCGFMGAVIIYLFIFGAMKSFEGRFNKFIIGPITYFFSCLAPIPIMPLAIVLESIAVMWGMLAYKHAGFHIVNKQVKSTGSKPRLHQVQVV